MKEFRCKGKLKTGNICNRLLFKYGIVPGANEIGELAMLQGEIKCLKCKNYNKFDLLDYIDTKTKWYLPGVNERIKRRPVIRRKKDWIFGFGEMDKKKIKINIKMGLGQESIVSMPMRKMCIPPLRFN